MPVKRRRVLRPVEQAATEISPNLLLASPQFVLSQHGSEIRACRPGGEAELVHEGAEVIATISRDMMAVAVGRGLAVLTSPLFATVRTLLPSEIVAIASLDHFLAVATACGSVFFYDTRGESVSFYPGDSCIEPPNTQAMGVVCVASPDRVVGSRALVVVELGPARVMLPVITMLDAIVAIAANASTVCVATDNAVTVVDGDYITRSVMMRDVASVALFGAHVVCARRSFPTRITVFGESPLYTFAVQAGTALVPLDDACYVCGNDAVVTLVRAHVLDSVQTYHHAGPVTAESFCAVAAALAGRLAENTIAWNNAYGIEFEAQLDGMSVDQLHTLDQDFRRGGRQLSFSITPGGEDQFTCAAVSVGWVPANLPSGS
jgi:hypothetical protein